MAYVVQIGSLSPSDSRGTQATGDGRRSVKAVGRQSIWTIRVDPVDGFNLTATLVPF